LTARLKSDNGTVRTLLTEHLAELRNSLKDAGVNMKDLEVTQPRIGTELSGRQHKHDGAETAGERNSKIGGISAITENAEPAGGELVTAAYATGRVTEIEDGSQFDYRA
jgi:flagellar hook-length control protein FliK